MLGQHKTNFWNIIKWFFIATGVGIVVGAMDALFLKLLDAALGLRRGVPFYYLGLPFFIYIIYLLARKAAPQDRAYSTDAVVNKINSYQPISLISILKGFALSIATMTLGGSAGKEAPCADVGAGLGSFFGNLFGLSAQERRKLMICGVSAGFAGVFGVPISGAIFGLEVLWVGHIFYEVMFPALVAGITAFQVTQFLGVNYVYHPLNFMPVFSEQFFLKVIVAGLFFGIISVLFIEISKFAKVLFRYLALKTRVFWACIAAGLVLVAVGYFASPVYLGLGMAGIDGPLSGHGPDSPLGFLYKIITTAVTFAAGGVGGIVTPVFFVGAQAGAMLSDFLQVDSATLAAIGLVAVLAGTTNTPLASSIMAIELFGAAIAPYATVSCVISFLITGRQSIYPSQRIMIDKTGEAPQIPMEESQKIPRQKGLFKRLSKDLVKHLIPSPKGFEENQKK